MELRDVIQELSAEQDGGHAALARKHGGLAVIPDLAGLVVLLPDTTVVGVEWDTGTVQAADARLTLSAHLRAVELHPELIDLLPDRPRGTPDCMECLGTGQLSGLSSDLPPWVKTCSTCVGLGWLLPGLP